MVAKIKAELSNLVKKKNIYLVKRGNTAILSALKSAKQKNIKNIIIPDQAGWLTYNQYAKKLKFNITELKTNLGVINPDELESVLKKQKKSPSALIISSIAAYYAEQPVEKIVLLCKKYSCLLINDITASVGSEKINKDLSKGDILVCSFGKQKPVNLGKAGFIATDELTETEEIELTDQEQQLLLEKIINLPKTWDSFSSLTAKVKKELSEKGYDILHRNLFGINVIAGFKNEKEKQELIDYCEKNNYEYKICPMYIKVDTDAVDIELVRELD